MTDIAPDIDRILMLVEQADHRYRVLVGISGIDASGKGYVAGMMTSELRERGLRVANINVDGWLNLRHVRFSDVNPAEHFDHYGLRLDEMFEQLVMPLRNRRSHRIIMDFAEETADQFRKRAVQFRDIDVVVVEGIFLFKPAYRKHFDLRLWIDCSMKTALNEQFSGVKKDCRWTRRCMRTTRFTFQPSICISSAIIHKQQRTRS